MARIKIERHELCVGVALPWAAYDEQGRVLVNKAQTIDSLHQLDSLIDLGLYRDDGAVAQPSSQETAAQRHADPFDALNHIAFDLGQTFSALCAGRASAGDALMTVCHGLMALYREHSDAMLGAVHLLNKTPYSVWHAIDTALICELLGKPLGMAPARRVTLAAAALTSNIGMLQLQETLYRQSTPLSDAQRQRVREHPQRSVDILQGAGIGDPRWLTAVAQHHERLNGKGYPDGLTGDAISAEAEIIGLADHYAALVSDRIYRSALSPFDALGDFLFESHDEFDPGHIQCLTRELGTYPPGTLVRLKNGETAVVIKRGQYSTAPVASSFLSPREELYEHPFQRDCTCEEFAVKAHCTSHQPLDMNLPRLWGYR